MISDENIIVSISDLKPQFCNGGSRTWGGLYGISWNDLIDRKVTAARLEATDGLGKMVAATARRRVNGG